MLEFFYAICGLAILLIAGDALVRGAVNASIRLGVSALVVSLTIVAIGTSAPEALVSVDAMLNNSPGIAIGNVIGSNTANILLVLGVPALLVGLNIADHDTRAAYAQVLFGTGVFVVLAAFAPIQFVGGLVLVALFLMFMLLAIKSARNAPEEAENDLEGLDPAMRWRRIILYMGVGLVGLPLGAELLVTNASLIAKDYGISEAVIGLTLVAIGTSLPELATTVSAAFRRQADVALGNVLGSNMANILGIVGLSAMFGDIPISSELLRFDIMTMVGATLVLAPFVFWRLNIGRAWGVILTAGYIAYVVALLV